jgi:SHS2 domain-containing protein
MGVLALAVDPSSVGEHETRVVRAHGDTLADLLVNWLNECLYVLEIEGFLARNVELITCSLDTGAGGEPMTLHCLLRGEELDPLTHGQVQGLPRVNHAGAAVEEVGEGFEARVMTGP